MIDSLGDRMKLYEGKETNRQFLPLLPICARIDGKCFHNFTKGLERPYDRGFLNLMDATTRYLVEETQASLGYTQSDEISLVWYTDKVESEIFFTGKAQKMVSVLASMATAFFNQNKGKFLPSKKDTLALFDCRIWQVPTLEEAVNTFIWREQDAVRNSISMLTRHYFSHKECYKKSIADMHDMLYSKGFNWNDFPPRFKNGAYFQRYRTLIPFTREEIDKLPPKHKARTNPDLKIERWKIREITSSIMSQKDRIGFVFRGIYD